jgi:hypothetical protein
VKDRAHARHVGARAAVLLASLGVAAGTGCAHAPPPTPTQHLAPIAVDVDVDLIADADERVSALGLSLCPRARQPWPRRLAPENRRALGALVSATDEEGRALDVGTDGVRTLGVSGCVRLVVDVGGLADAAQDKDVALRVGDDLVATPDVWLWRPDPFPADAHLYVRLTPGPFQSVVPWSEREVASAAGEGRFIVDARTFALKSDAAFGTFTTRAVEVPGGVLEVTALGNDAPPAQLQAWLLASANAVAGLSGKFPVPRLGVLVCAQPAPRPVLVGFFSRGGGPIALFFVASQASDVTSDDHESTGRWAITHELAHAWLPAVTTEDAWFNEGLATWHQDVLARRAGLIANDESYWNGVLRGLDTGAARAKEDGLSLRDASARMHDARSYQHAYWGGVALLLVAEVQARQQGASIDDVVLFLRRRFPQDDRPRGALELLAIAEREGGPVALAARAWRTAYERAADAPFPDARPALEALGVRRDAAGVLVLDDEAPLAYLRRALTASTPRS